MDPTSAPELSSGMSGYAESSAGACCGNHECYEVEEEVEPVQAKYTTRV